jgi:hypothetical protein
MYWKVMDSNGGSRHAVMTEPHGKLKRETSEFQSIPRKHHIAERASGSTLAAVGAE